MKRENVKKKCLKNLAIVSFLSSDDCKNRTRRIKEVAVVKLKTKKINR